MSTVFQVGNQKMAAEEIISLLTKSQLLPQVMREIVIEKAIAPINHTPEELDQALHQLQQQPQFQGMTQEQQKAIALRQLKVEKFKQTNWGNKVESYFISRKAQLDKVIFSLLQSKNAEVAQELYFRILEGEQDFPQLASEYSQGPESRTGGLVGPIKLASLHPTLAQVLMSTQVGKLSPIFRVDNSFVLVRLEQFLPVQLDQPLRQQLTNELFEQWVQTQISQSPGTNLEPAKDNVIATTPELAKSAVSKAKTSQKIGKLPEEALLSEEGATPYQTVGNQYSESPQMAVVEEQPNDEELLETTLAKTPEPTLEPKKTSPAPAAKPRGNKKLAAAMLLCLAAVGFTGFYLNSTSQARFEKSGKISAHLPDAAEVSEQESFRVAVNYAMEAANLTQTARNPEQWKDVAAHWQGAMALMKAVPSQSPDYQKAQEKIPEYKGYFSYAQHQAQEPVDAFRVAVNNAMKASRLTQFAKSSEEWDLVASHWQQAIALMKAVEQDSPNHEVAVKKSVEYGNYLRYARQRATR